LDNQNRRLNNHNHSQVATSSEVTFMIWTLQLQTPFQILRLKPSNNLTQLKVKAARWASNNLKLKSRILE
jgi:hypothetical protein